MATVSGRTLNPSLMLDPMIFWNSKQEIPSAFSMSSSHVGPMHSFGTVRSFSTFFRFGSKYR